MEVFLKAANEGVWCHPLQRNPKIQCPPMPPDGGLPFLQMRGWSELDLILKAVRRRWGGIRRNFLTVIREQRVVCYTKLHVCPAGRRCWKMSNAPRVGRWEEGAWGHFYIAPANPSHLNKYSWDGTERGCNPFFPVVCNLLLMLLKTHGIYIRTAALTQVEGPRTVIPKHRGPAGSLRLLCPIQVPKNGSSVIRWPYYAEREFREKDCWWLDESYEHEVEHEAPGPRTAFFMDVPSPTFY